MGVLRNIQKTDVIMQNPIIQMISTSRRRGTTLGRKALIKVPKNKIKSLMLTKKGSKRRWSNFFIRSMNVHNSEPLGASIDPNGKFINIRRVQTRQVEQGRGKRAKLTAVSTPPPRKVRSLW